MGRLTATYIRRTHFTKAGRTLHDFTPRAEDLFTLIPIVPDGAPEWVSRPYLRGQLADEAADASSRPAEVRAWHVCGDLKAGLTRGQWADQVEEITRAALPKGIVAEIAIHVPRDKPPHAHVLVAARYPTRLRYGCSVLWLFCARLPTQRLSGRHLAEVAGCGSEPVRAMTRRMEMQDEEDRLGVSEALMRSVIAKQAD